MTSMSSGDFARYLFAMVFVSLVTLCGPLQILCDRRKTPSNQPERWYQRTRWSRMGLARDELRDGRRDHRWFESTWPMLYELQQCRRKLFLSHWRRSMAVWGRFGTFRFAKHLSTYSRRLGNTPRRFCKRLRLLSLKRSLGTQILKRIQ